MPIRIGLDGDALMCVVLRGRLRCCSHCILHGLLLQRYHRMGHLLLLRFVYHPAAVDNVQQLIPVVRIEVKFKVNEKIKGSSTKVSRLGSKLRSMSSSRSSPDQVEVTI